MSPNPTTVTDDLKMTRWTGHECQISEVRYSEASGRRTTWPWQFKASTIPFIYLFIFNVNKRDGSVVKCVLLVWCSCEGPQVKVPASTLVSSQLPIIPAPEDPIPSFGLRSHLHSGTHPHKSVSYLCQLNPALKRPVLSPCALPRRTLRPLRPAAAPWAHSIGESV